MDTSVSTAQSGHGHFVARHRFPPQAVWTSLGGSYNSDGGGWGKTFVCGGAFHAVSSRAVRVDLGQEAASAAMTGIRQRWELRPSTVVV